MGYENSGRRPKSPALKRLQGNPGKRTIAPELEPKPAGPVVKPPGLSVGASAMWDELSPVCLQMGTLTAADVATFAKLCELEATCRAASGQKDRPGFTIFLHTTMVDSAGNEHQQVKIHPAIKLEGETATKLRPYYDYFGMTPSGRARIHVKKDEPANPWKEILAS